MALIKCPECGTEVSDRAAACPRCAHPLATTAPPVVGQVTIEKTGKSLKGQMLLALAVMVIGSAVTCSGSFSDEQRVWGAVIAFSGLVWMMLTRIRRWWQHD